MDLSPEEKKRIYEEEKARIEAREQIKQEKQKKSEETSTGLMPNIAGLLCYIGGWITGIIFFVLEQKNSWLRFHAAQSIIVFGTITVVGTVLRLIPIVGDAFSTIVYIVGFILWIVLMVKAYNGERYRIIWAGDIAEKMVSSPGETMEYQKPPPATSAEMEKPIPPKAEGYVAGKRDARIAASAFGVAWSVVLIIFFNFFNQYVAYYHTEEIGGATIWTRHPFFTEDINLWLPVLTTALVISIIGHLVLIILDRYILHETVLTIIDAFGLAAVLTLLSVFPFDFGVIPDTSIAAGAHLGVRIILIFISFGIGVGIIVRLIKFIVNIARGVTSYQDNA